jgi:hypothetical protein
MPRSYHSLPRRAADDDDASAMWPKEPSRRGRRRQRYCRGVRAVAGTEDDADGWDLPPPPARRRRMRRCRCPLRPTTETTTTTRARDDATRGGGATTRDESGRWTAQGERVESDEGTTRDMELYVFVICAEKAEKNVVTWSFYAFVIFITN